MRKISVIIPCYNAEDYIEKSFESLISLSNFKEIEVILVDDCSTDNTAAIINNYSKNHSNFKCIFNEVHPKGLMQSRNIALENATAEYVVFLDSSDIIINDGYKVLLDTIEEYRSDLVIACRMTSQKNELTNCGEQCEWVETPFYNRSNIHNKISIVERAPYHFHSIFKRSIIEENKLRFIDNIQMAEDEIFCNEYLKVAKKITKINSVVCKKSLHSNDNSAKKIDFDDFKEYSIIIQCIKQSLDIYPLAVYLERCVALADYFTLQLFRLCKREEQIKAFDKIAEFVNDHLRTQIVEEKITPEYNKALNEYISIYSNRDFDAYMRFYENDIIALKKDRQLKKPIKSNQLYKLDIVIAFKDSTKKIIKLIDDIIKSTVFESVCIIIMDTNSKENNQLYFENKYLNKYDNIKYYFCNSSTYLSAYNKISKLKTSEYIAFFNENTIIGIGTIEKTLNFIKENKAIDIIAIANGAGDYEEVSLEVGNIEKFNLNNLDSKVVKNFVMDIELSTIHSNMSVLSNYYINNFKDSKVGVLHSENFIQGQLNVSFMKLVSVVRCYNRAFKLVYTEVLQRVQNLKETELLFFEALVLLDFIQLRKVVKARRGRKDLTTMVEYHQMILSLFEVLGKDSVRIVGKDKIKPYVNLKKSFLISKTELLLKRKENDLEVIKKPKIIKASINPILVKKKKVAGVNCDCDIIFSIVIPLYNSESYIEDTLTSIYNQVFELSRVEVIVVDDGSSDNGASIVKEFQSRYDNLRYIYQENSGPSVARNLGIEQAVGKYIGLIDSDDIYSNNALSEAFDLFENHQEDIDVVSMPIHLFGFHNASHNLNEKFDDGKRIVDLKEEPELIQASMASAFFRGGVIKRHKYMDGLNLAEDLKVITIILEEKSKIGLSSNSAYFYRRHAEGSLMNLSAYNIPMYTQLFEDVYFDLLKMFPDSERVHYIVAWEFGFKVCSRLVAEEMSTTQFEIYMYNAKNLVKKLMPQSIINCDNLSKVDVIYFMQLHDKDFVDKIVYEDDSLRYKGINLEHIFDDKKVHSILFRLTDDNLESIISIKNTYNFLIDKIFLMSDKGIVGEYNYLNKDQVNTLNSFSIPVINNMQYKLQVDLDNETELYLKVVLKNGTEFIPDWIFSEKKVANMLFEEDKRACIISEKRVCFLADDDSCVKISGDTKVIKKKERKLVSYLSSFDDKIVQAYHQSQKRKSSKGKKIWLLSDRDTNGGDNAQALFEYVSRTMGANDDIDYYFVINKDAEDFKIIEEFGTVIARNSVEYYLMLMIADVYLSSHIMDFVYNFRVDGSLAPLKSLITYKKVFLQHGVAEKNIRSYVNSFNTYLDSFVVSTELEKNNISTFNLGYDDIVLETGLARYDKLDADNKGNVICIMPTWRKQLLKKTSSNNALDVSREAFFQSDFFIQYKQLLNDKAFIDFVEQHNYEIWFVPHPDFYNAIPLLTVDERIVVKCRDVIYKEIFEKSSCLVTDISSMQSDFAYMNRMVYYFQPDYDVLYSDTSAHKKGLFSYEIDGFGPVSYSSSKLIDDLKWGIETGFKQNSEYKRRAESFFLYHDKENCKRVYDSVNSKFK